MGSQLTRAWIFVLVSLLIGGLAGCQGKAGDTGAGEPTAEIMSSSDLWSQVEGYSTWEAVPGRAGVFPSESGSAPYVAEWMSPEALQWMAARESDDRRLPAGAFLVRACYDDVEGSALTSVTVMGRQPGADPAHDDWVWAKFDPAGASVVGPAEGAATCSSCHAARATDNDWILSFEL